MTSERETQIFLEREERIKWYIQIHYNHFMQYFLQTTDEKIKKDYAKKIEKWQNLARQLYGS